MRAMLMPAAVAAMLALIASEAAARTVIRGEGSRGDRFDIDECPAGQVLVGVAGKTGDWINGIQIICAALQPDGRSARGAHRGPVRGTDSGMPNEGSCPLGGKVTSASTMYTSREKRLVFNVALDCTPRGGAGVTAVASRPGDNDYSFDRGLVCQEGEVMTGLAVNSGRHVNNIGIVCDVVDPPAAAAAPPAKRTIPSRGRAPARSAGEPGQIGQFDLPFATESSLGGKFDIKLQVVGMRGPGQFRVTGTLTNTDIGPQYNGTFDGTMAMSNLRRVQLSYVQPAANARGTVTFHFSEDGETITGEGWHMGSTPFQWNGRRKHGPN